MNAYRRVTYEDRCQIFALLKTGLNKSKIADTLNLHKSTVSRELRRNRSSRGYKATSAQYLAKKRRVTCRRRAKITPQLARVIRRKLTLTWSPEQIAGRLKRLGKASVSTPAIYRFVSKDDSLRCFLKMYKRRGGGRHCQRKARPKWERTIEARPKIANKRKRFGDWERDTLYA